MILLLSLGLIFIGFILCLFDIFIPIEFLAASGIPYMMLQMLRFMGGILGLMGAVILGVRIKQVGVGFFINPVNIKNVILEDVKTGNNPNARFLKGTLDDLGHIRCKNKLFKDTGGGIRIAGHDVRRVHEKICFSLPDWLIQYLYQIKKKYRVKNQAQLKGLYDKLQKLDPMKSKLEQLEAITELKDAMFNKEHPEYREYLLRMTFDDLINMGELLYDGTVIHMEDAENFIDAATPNELDAYVDQKITHRMSQQRSFTTSGGIDKNFILLVIILLIGASIAFAVIMGVLK